MRVLYVTPEWPRKEYPAAGTYLVNQVEFLRQAGIEVDVFPFRGRRSLIKYSQVYRQLQRTITHGAYDLAHAHFGHSGFLLTLPKRLPLVVTFHGSDLIGFYSKKKRYEYITPLFRLAMRFVSWRADQIILVANHLSKYINRRDYHVIPCGIDLKLFQPQAQELARQKLGLPYKKKLVIFVGNIHRPVKRYDLATSAIKTLSEYWPEFDVELIPVFDVQRKVVPLYMNAADALLLTSKHEGSPTVIKEAMACNLPIVSTDVGDVRERLELVTRCSVISTDSAMDIAQELAEILKFDRRTNGREIAQGLSEHFLAKRNIEVYHTAIKNYKDNHR